MQITNSKNLVIQIVKLRAINAQPLDVTQQSLSHQH
jgi:hypothetical protein